MLSQEEWRVYRLIRLTVKSAGLNFRIRGQSSISAGSDPLYVLDGVPLINDDESSNGAPTNFDYFKPI